MGGLLFFIVDFIGFFIPFAVLGVLAVLITLGVVFVLLGVVTLLYWLCCLLVHCGDCDETNRALMEP